MQEAKQAAQQCVSVTAAAMSSGGHRGGVGGCMGEEGLHRPEVLASAACRVIDSMPLGWAHPCS